MGLLREPENLKESGRFSEMHGWQIGTIMLRGCPSMLQIQAIVKFLHQLCVINFSIVKGTPM